MFITNLNLHLVIFVQILNLVFIPIYGYIFDLVTLAERNVSNYTVLWVGEIHLNLLYDYV